MRSNPLPVNLSILQLTPQKLALMRPVTVMDITEGASNNFHADGLYSTEIFGRVGSEERDLRFSYIKIHVKIFHPLIYKHIVKLKGFYQTIMNGRAYAVWDPKTRDFIASTETEGSTGYSFFLKHWAELEFQPTGSDIRDVRIQFINKYRKDALVDHVLVIPAGLRDVTVDNNGRMEQPEINELYKGILSAANTVGNVSDPNSPIYDVTRFTLQLKFNELFAYIQNLLDGKRGFMQNKWAKRKIFNATRNVITAMDTSVADMSKPRIIGPNDTIVGVYQMAKAALPITKHALQSGWVSLIFNTHDGHARLVNPKTLQAESVRVGAELIDLWTSSDGLEKIINRLAKPSLRGDVVMVGEHYIGLVYNSPLGVKFLSDIRDLPKGFSRDDVQPITLIELVYMDCYKRWSELYGFVTRYPVADEGSTYPSHAYVKTTIPGLSRVCLDDNWESMGDVGYMPEYPDRTVGSYVESMMPSPSRLKGLGGDFDGDMASFNVVYSTDSLKELSTYLASRRAYLNADGGLVASPFTDTVEYVLHNLTA